jgi:hypothetical protein
MTLIDTRNEKREIAAQVLQNIMRYERIIQEADYPEEREPFESLLQRERLKMMVLAKELGYE